MTRVQIPDEHVRFLSAAGLGTALAAREFLERGSDDERKQVADVYQGTRATVKGLVEGNRTRAAEASAKANADAKAED